MENIITKQHLIEYLSFVRDCELEKPVNEINHKLVCSCGSLLVKLQSKKQDFSNDYFKQKAESIPFIIMPDFSKEIRKSKKHIKLKRVLIIAATIILLYIFMTLNIGISTSTEDKFFMDLVEAIGIENIEDNKVFIINGTTFVRNKEPVRYDDINDYPDDNPYDILLPTYMPEGIKLNSLFVLETAKEQYRIVIPINIPSLAFCINLDSEIPQAIIDTTSEVTTINGKTVYIQSLTDVGRYQMFFEHNGDYYELGFSDKEELFKIIESMEE